MQCLKLLRSYETLRELVKSNTYARYVFACNNYKENYFHTSAPWTASYKCQKWLSYNRKIWPPQSPEEERRPAFVCHVKTDIHYSPKKMWYVACLVRGLSVDEAVKQLSFVSKKGAAAAKEAILEAQEKAVERHNVEFKSNLWVAESFVNKGRVVKGLRRHARGRTGEIRYTHCHYFVRLEEGRPPPSQAHYYAHNKPILSQQDMLDQWLTKMRSRKITNSL